MIEEEEMEKQVNDGTFDECAYVKDDNDLFMWRWCLSIMLKLFLYSRI